MGDGWESPELVNCKYTWNEYGYLYNSCVILWNCQRKKMENGVNYLSKFDARMKGHVVDVPQ